jgi:hypothetical protein
MARVPALWRDSIKCLAHPLELGERENREVAAAVSEYDPGDGWSVSIPADPPQAQETGAIPPSGYASIGLRSTDFHLSAQATVACYS